MKFRFLKVLLIVICTVQLATAQRAIKWTPDGNAYTKTKDGGIVRVDPKTDGETVLVKKEQLTPAGASKALVPQSYSFSNDNSKVLIFTNTAKVWRYNTRGDYWVLDIAANKLTQLGKGRPEKSLMFAKFSPDGKMAAYVSEHNLYAEDLSSGRIIKL